MMAGWKCSILKRRCQMECFFNCFVHYFEPTMQQKARTVKRTLNSWVRTCLTRHHRIFPNQLQTSGSGFPAFAELSYFIFSISAPFPSDSMSHFTSKFSPTGFLKGLLHTYCPTHFSLHKTLPVLWFFKQASVSEVLEKKKNIISLPLTPITIHPRISWVAQSSAGLWESFLQFAGLLKPSRGRLLNYVWVIFNGSPVCPSLKAAVMESGYSPVFAFIETFFDNLTA